MAVVNPSQMDELVSSFTGRVIYKAGGSHPGVFGSRLSPWADTLSVVKRRPWFGSGFGTSELGDLRPDIGSSSVYTMEGTNREHGNSYLALAEYMGLLGACPLWSCFLCWFGCWFESADGCVEPGIRTTIAFHWHLVAIAGLVHACFEDWLFAVGSYLCLFFWVSVFLLMDLAPELRAERLMPASKPFPAFAQPQAIRQPTT